MPRGFSETQMQSFRKKLISRAFEALKTTGVSKTTVGDLTKTAGLSTGAFYKFFPSKEALFFAVYDIAEDRLKEEFLSTLQASTEVTTQELGLAIKQLFRSETMQALLRLMQKDELDYMLRNVDAERIEQHNQEDLAFLQNVLDLLSAKGMKVKIEVNLLLSYLQALFVLCYAKDQYHQHAERVIDTFIDTLVAETVE